MENASKALLMGAGILLAVLIIYIAMRMFSSASGVTESYQSQETSSEIATFNSNFTRFIGAVVKEGETTNQTYATIHDIITVSNFAWDYNLKKAKLLDINPITNTEDNGLIHINLYTAKKNEDKKDTEICKNLENKNNNIYENLINHGYYVSLTSPNAKNIVTYQMEINRYDAAGRIIEVTFYPSNTYDSSTKETINDHLKEVKNTIDNTQSNKEWKY